MIIAYFEPTSGASGDMILGSLLDAGLDLAALKERLSLLHLEGWSIESRREQRGAIAATRALVETDENSFHAHHLADVLKVLDASDLADGERDAIARVFRALAAAEAEAHGTTLEKVHFHEVGALDAVVDVASAVIALGLLGVDEVLVGPIALGTGTVETSHGMIPVPAPATLNLLTGMRTVRTSVAAELTTPTGAAILSCRGRSVDPGTMTIGQIGYGAGSRDLPGRSNALRVSLGSAEGADCGCWMVETNLDDVSGEVIGAAQEANVAAGAVDLYLVPVQMKKRRPGVILTAIATDSSLDAVRRTMIRETGSFGLRFRRVGRLTLERHHETVETPYGAIPVKVGVMEGERVVVAPEYEDCAAAAARAGAPVRVVLAAARGAADA